VTNIQKVELTDAEAGPASLQRTVRICRYARGMVRRAAKNLLLAALAMALGLMLGAVTKFGLGYDLAADASPAKIVAKN
jgi:hypothetical protein